MGTAIIDARGPLVTRSQLTAPAPGIIFQNRAYYKLDNNGSGGVSLVDSTGNGNTLTNNGGVTLGAGIINGGAFFNEASLSSSTMFLGGTGNFATSLWIKPDGNQNFYPAALSTRTSDTGDDSVFGLGYEIGGSDIVFIFAGSFVTSASYIVPFDSWTHIAWVRKDSISYLYINGALASSDADTRNYTATTAYIGNNADGGLAFSGSIDEVGIWTRALSDNEVLALYNSGAGLTYPFTN
jgi:hypothetical protein